MKPLDILYLCDWLPPDFGAVGQYSLLFSTALAKAGEQVALVGLSSEKTSVETQNVGAGALEVKRIHRRPRKGLGNINRLIWTLGSNVLLLWHSRQYFWRCRRILITGSPPFMILFAVPLARLFRKRLIYRITDFYPEVIFEARGYKGVLGSCFYWVTLFLRKRADEFEVLGLDQKRRLLSQKIPVEKITLKRDPSPITFSPSLSARPRPPETDGKVLLLYSGNFGVAHDHETFLAAYRQHHASGSGRVFFWLNAVGEKCALIEQELRKLNLPFLRTPPVDLGDLPALLKCADVHLVTLKDEFVGYVLPSKIYACLDSGRKVLFVGSVDSDVNYLGASGKFAPDYYRAEVGDVSGLAERLEKIADDVTVKLNASRG